MKKSSKYVYYSLLSQKILKIKYLHIFFLFIENFLTMFLIFDCSNMIYGKTNIHLKLIQICNLNHYLNQSLVLCIIVLFFLLIYLFYFLSEFLLKFKCFQIVFINFYEIFHIRVLSFFYLLALFSLHNIQLIIAYVIAIFYFLVSISHIINFHLPIYSLEYVRFVYDSFSSIFDSIELTIKTLFILSNSLAEKYNGISKHFFYISMGIYIFQSINILYIMKTKSFLFMNNVLLNKLRISMVFFKLCITFLSLGFATEGITKKRMSILYINFFLISIIIFMLIYNPYEHIYLRTYGYMIENSYYYFFSIYSNNEKNKLLFYHKINECANKEFLTESVNVNTITHNFLCDNDYFQLILLFYKEIKQNKLHDLWKSRCLMIRLIFLINKYKTTNFIISMNLKALFDIINLNNNIEKTYDVVYRLELMIHFIDDAHGVLFFLNDIIHKNFNVTISELVELSHLIDKINSKTYKNKLLKNKSVESSYFSIVCGVFYEEILNKSLIKHNFQIRENIVQYEDSINFLYENNNKITLTLNLSSDECRIIQIGRDLFDHFNNDFSLLFPEEFREYQMILFKNGIFDLNFVLSSQKRRSIHEKRQSNLFNLLKSPPTTKDVSFKFIVKKNKRGELGLLYIDLKMLFDNTCKDYIVLNGYYFLGKNCLFTYKKNFRDTEKIYKLDLNTNDFDDEEKPPETLKQYLKTYKIYKSKLTQIHSFQLNGLTYIIYNIEENKSHQETDIISLLQIATKNVNDTYLEKYNQKVEDSSSVAGSLLSGASTGDASYFSNHMRRLSNKKSQSHKQVYILHIYQRLIFIISVISLFSFIVELFIKKNKKDILFNNYSILTNFRTLIRLYYHGVPSFMLTMCLAKKDESNCTQYLSLYNEKFDERYPGVYLNFTKYFFSENKFKVENFKNVCSVFFNEIYSLKDPRTDKFFQYEINYINILQNDGYFYLVNQTIEFKEAIKILFNTMAILTADNSYAIKPIYLLNITTNPLSTIHFNSKLEDYQLSYYSIISNFNTFCQYWNKIHHEFNDVMDSKLNSYKNLNYYFLSLNIIIYMIFLIIVFLYLESYKKVSLEIFNIIKKRTNSKEFRMVFTKKIELLSVLLKIYSVNPTQIIGNLDDLYSSYKKKEREKAKNKNQNGGTAYDDLQLILYTKEDMSKSHINLLYTHIFLVIFTLFIIIHLGIFTMYLIYFKKYKLVFKLLSQSSLAECTGYRDFTFYVNRLYNNITEDLMKNWMNKTVLQDTSDIIYTLYLITRERQGLGDLYQPLSYYFTIDCADFYEKIQDSLIEKVNEYQTEENIYSKLSSFCYQNKIMEYNDQYKINTEQFSYIRKGLIQTDYYDMEQVIETLNSNEFFRSGLFCLLIFRPLRTAENNFVNINALSKMKLYIGYMNYIDTLLGLFSEFFILFICIFIFIKKINNFHKQIARIKDIFLVCHFDNSSK